MWRLENGGEVKKVFAVMLVTFGMHSAMAEIVTGVWSEGKIDEVGKGAKVFTNTFSTGSRDKIKASLKDHGYEPSSAREAEYFIQVNRLDLAVELHEKIKRIQIGDLEDYADFNVKPAIVDLANVDAALADIGGVRSPLDMDAGVISKGAQLTGSATGGLVVGLMGSLIGGAVDALSNNAKEVKQPSGVVLLVGAITKKGAIKPNRVVIQVTSTTEETPEALLDAALSKFVGLMHSGYMP